jgi:hypothetical protein
MKPSSIFIASSSEGLIIVDAVQELLEKYLGPSVKIRPWTREFELSDTYIESLEKATLESDFAILVISPDDVTISRKTEKLSPRDNVVFELGLFMGALGRGRCFILHERRPDLKMPTDLLGVETATYLSSPKLKPALAESCSRIAARVKALGERVKPDEEFLMDREQIRKFSNRIEGYWFEHVLRKGVNTISWFEIEPELQINSFNITGKSHDQKGVHVANWRSLIGRFYARENKIMYYWEGSHILDPNHPFHGIGEMEFEKASGPDKPFVRGSGKFWDVDESHPERTVIKPIRVRRIEDEDMISLIREGNPKKISTMLQKVLKEW